MQIEALNPSIHQEKINQRFWVVANLWEAAIGLGDESNAAKWEREAQAMNVAEWRHETRETQAEKLRQLLNHYHQKIKALS